VIIQERAECFPSVNIMPLSVFALFVASSYHSLEGIFYFPYKSTHRLSLRKLKSAVNFFAFLFPLFISHKSV
jgi:hypothetical protein